MKRSRILICLIVMIFMAAVFSGCGQSAPDDGNDTSQNEINATIDPTYGARGALSDDDLSMEEMLLYAIQDEYLAHAEYEYILDTFGEQTPFANIILSEEQHISMLTEIYEAYDITLPADDGAEHVIVPSDIEEALETGVQAEIDNIAMYEKFLTHDLPEDVEAVFVALRDASVNHLDAFETRLERYQQ